MFKKVSVLIALIAAPFVLTAHTSDEDWEKYSAPKYGFEMQIPKGVKLTEEEKSGGWADLHGTYEAVELHVLAKLGAAESKEEIRKFAEKECGIPGENWKKVDSGENSSGWKWYEIYVAEKGDTVIFGGLGTGAKGNYLAFLKTTKADYEAHKEDYEAWVASIKLN